MTQQGRQQFDVIGITVRTSNENGQAGQDIPALWAQFMRDGLLEKIPNKADHSLHCIYTDYEKDHTKPYTTLLGCRVSNISDIPEGMTARTFEEANYVKYTVKGDISTGLVYNAWTEIWNSDLNRAFTHDFEVYDLRANNLEHAVVDIFVAVK